ncbi:sulfite exporter TauE/SafE family protein [Thermococcus sp. M36]|uniref:sulfite exporter TauE/SafE family protein n=1 Tax=Thermococcus sp. M36 TaxID=1638261 RepID=UPI00143A51C3|nr:sulfite exporter TauE/SafE family protein [Thermococcus sp. M36]NJE06143.1 sulfite exporter TauE/SafE family protein [Thermococcus sp. M36]
MVSYVLSSLLGLGIGVIAGTFGVGGGFLIVPTLTFAGLPLNVAIGTSLACITISSLSSAFMHIRGGRVLYKVALITAAFSIPLAVAGSYVSAVINEKALEVLFSLLLFYLAYIFTKPEKEASTGEEAGEIRYKRIPPIGMFSGLASGLLGVSGGILNVPLFHSLARLPVKYAVGTSSFALFFTSLVAAYTHYTLGQVDVSTALLLIPGMVVGSFLGARMVSRMPSRGLKMAFALLLVIVAFRMLL